MAQPPYNSDAGGDAASALDTSTGEEAGGKSGGQKDTFFLPDAFEGAENLKKGDIIELRVVGPDQDGDIEVEHVSTESGDKEAGEGEAAQGEGSMSLRDDLENSLK